MKILIGPSSFGEVDQTPLNKLTQAGAEIIPNPYGRKLTKAELGALLPGVSGIIAGLEALTRDVLEQSQLKVISRCGSGMSNVDQHAAQQLGIKVFSTPFGPTNAVAELTIACLLALLRQLPQADSAMHRKIWEKRTGSELCGKKAAVIGFGRIGQRVGHLLAAFQAEVIAVDPLYDGCQPYVKHLELAEALNVADVLSLHSSSERLLLGPAEFEKMKRGVFILNAARGILIDEQALLNAIKAGKVAGAWLDTYADEPYRGELCAYPQVILTPHIGSYTVECRRTMEMESVENLLKGLQSE